MVSSSMWTVWSGTVVHFLPDVTQRQDLNTLRIVLRRCGRCLPSHPAFTGTGRTTVGTCCDRPSPRHSFAVRSRLSVAAALVMSLLVPVPGADATPAGGSTVVGDALTAMAAARAQRVPVEDLSARTEVSRVFANPTGTWTMESSATPRWVRRDGTWVDVDTTLVRRGDGSPAPRASAADVRFSAGGDGPLVTLNHAAHTFTLSWPGLLPAISAGQAAPFDAGGAPAVPEPVPERSAGGNREPGRPAAGRAGARQPGGRRPAHPSPPDGASRAPSSSQSRTPDTARPHPECWP
ncbi:hypothetical protein DFJ66_7792 [Saccharothrix variisporea]|uniref:Uncharacterized protein n=1 Tax=Saccharothrix variisporea TaxID=543527 RepID=A0A495XMK5_9PSEU|nr:hypothetical protein DFJ66_7792 [Saccharothrix variisporea]